eukprot:g4241.t1
MITEETKEELPIPQIGTNRVCTPLFFESHVEEDGAPIQSPFQNARPGETIAGTSGWYTTSPQVSTQVPQGGPSTPLSPLDGLNSSSTLPPNLSLWSRSREQSRRLPGGQRASGASFTFIGDVSVYRSSRRRSFRRRNDGHRARGNDASERTLSLPANYNSLFTACFRPGRLFRGTENGTSGPTTRTTAMERNFEPETDGFLDEDWESRKTCFVNIGAASEQLRHASCPAPLADGVHDRVSSLERMYNKVFSTGNPEFSTRLSLPVNRDFQTRVSIFPKTETGSDFELSDVAFKTVMEFNGVWKTQSGGKDVHRALAAMSMKKRAHKTCGGGVRYLLIDSTRSHFRTSTWTNATEHQEQRPWNEQAVLVEKSICQASKRISVMLNGSSIRANTKWSDSAQTQLTQEYSLSPDLKRLKVVYTIEKINNLSQSEIAVATPAVKTYMVHTMLFRRQP